MLETYQGDLAHFDPTKPGAGDERLPVEFYKGAVKDDAATEAASRPIWRDMECIRIYVSKDNIIDRPVRDSDKQRWPRAYQAFKNTGETDAGAVGTRLEHWPIMSRAQVEEFRYFKIFTVEQLATAPDNIGKDIMNFQRLKALAAVFIDAAKGEAPMIKMQAELDKRDGEIAFLKKELERLTGLMEKAKLINLMPKA